MIFSNRCDAGIRLATELKKYKDDPQVIVVAIPRGGVEVAFSVCQEIKKPMEVTIAKKIGAPFDSELAIGAVNEEGGIVLNESIIEEYDIDDEYIKFEADRKKKEIEKRLKKYRNGNPLVSFEGKKVVVIDDGIATGATMRAIIVLLKGEKAKKTIVAVPVADAEALNEIRKECDETICLLTPPFFGSVGSFYRNFEQLNDDRVQELLGRIKAGN